MRPTKNSKSNNQQHNIKIDPRQEEEHRRKLLSDIAKEVDSLTQPKYNAVSSLEDEVMQEHQCCIWKELQSQQPLLSFRQAQLSPTKTFSMTKKSLSQKTWIME